MKILVFCSSSLLKPQLGIQLEEAENYALQGNDVKFVYCKKCMNACSYNLYKSSLICNYCQNEYKRMINKKWHFSFVELIENANKKKHVFKYNCIDDIKRIIYKELEIGYACLSSYISATRNPEPTIDDKFRNTFDCLLENTCKLTNHIEDLLKKENPDKVFVYNGRLHDTYPVMQLCKKYNISFVCTEVNKFGTEYYKQYFENDIPHSPEIRCKQIYNYWETDSISLEEKTNIGKSFFQKRKNRESTNDKVYTKKQVSNLLPSDFDRNKRNYVIFNSSEDELASLGSEFAKKNLFKSQLEGIKYILDITKSLNNIHFYLRIHPNLAGLPFSYHTDLYKLSKYENITIIPPTAKIDSYAIMDACEKVIVFTSSMGIESVYWGKPVIVLGNTFYSSLKGFYKPENINLVKDLLLDDLKPMTNEDAIKYGYYLLRKNPEQRTRHINIDIYRLNIFGRVFETCNYQKRWNSRAIFSVFNLIILSWDRLIVKMKNKWRF